MTQHYLVYKAGEGHFVVTRDMYGVAHCIPLDEYGDSKPTVLVVQEPLEPLKAAQRDYVVSAHIQDLKDQVAALQRRIEACEALCDVPEIREGSFVVGSDDDSTSPLVFVVTSIEGDMLSLRCLNDPNVGEHTTFGRRGALTVLAPRRGCENTGT